MQDTAMPMILCSLDTTRQGKVAQPEKILAGGGSANYLKNPCVAVRSGASGDADEECGHAIMTLSLEAVPEIDWVPHLDGSCVRRPGEL